MMQKTYPRALAKLFHCFSCVEFNINACLKFKTCFVKNRENIVKCGDFEEIDDPIEDMDPLEAHRTKVSRLQLHRVLYPYIVRLLYSSQNFR